MRVGTLPRKSAISTSGLNANNCDFLLAEEVPTFAPFFKLNFCLSSSASSRIINQSAGFSREDTPAIINPSGFSVGKSLCE